MQLIQIGNRVVNLELMIIARLEDDEHGNVLTLFFSDDGTPAQFYDDEAIALWQYITAAMHCKKIATELSQPLVQPSPSSAK